MSKKAVDLKKQLRLAFKNWDTEKEEVKKGGFDEYDDGSYKARLVKAEVTTSSNGRLQVVMSWKFLSGEYKGKIKFDYQGIETEENRKYFGILLNRLGYETDAIENADDVLGILKDINKEKPEGRISLKTKGEFQNVKLLKLKGSDDDEEAEEDEDGDDEEEAAPKKKKGKKADDEEEDADEDESEDDDDEEEEKPKKKGKKKASEEEEEDDEEDESSDEDEDEDEKPKKKGKKKADDDDEEESDDEDDEEDEEDSDGDDVEIVPGSEIKYKFKGKKYSGTVLEVFSKTNQLRVETDDTKRKISLESVIDVTVPEEPKKKKAGLKKKK